MSVRQGNDLNPQPVAKQISRPKQNQTLFTTVNGEFVYLPTKEQAEIETVKFLKRFNPEDWWAQKVSRFRKGRDEMFVAYLKRDFSKKHDRSDLAAHSIDEMWFGRMEIGIPKMVTDDDPHSDTHNQRIPDTMPMTLLDGTVADLPVLLKRGFYEYTPVNKKNIELYKTMCGMTLDDNETEFVWVLKKGGRNVGCEDPDEFWEMSLDDATREDRLLKKIAKQKKLAGEEHKDATEKLN